MNEEERIATASVSTGLAMTAFIPAQRGITSRLLEGAALSTVQGTPDEVPHPLPFFLSLTAAGAAG
jgi:hypothetical protein